MQNMKLYRGRVIPEDIEDEPDHLKDDIKIDGKLRKILNYQRWKGEWLPLSYLNLMVGPQMRSKAVVMNKRVILREKNRPWKKYFASEIPPVAVMGENIYVSGVFTGVVMTLPTDPEKVIMEM